VAPVRARLTTDADESGCSVVLPFSQPHTALWRFEDADHLLLETHSRRSVAGVRCDGGTCERATRNVMHGLQFRTGFVLSRGE